MSLYCCRFKWNQWWYTVIIFRHNVFSFFAKPFKKKSLRPWKIYYSKQIAIFIDFHCNVILTLGFNFCFFTHLFQFLLRKLHKMRHHCRSNHDGAAKCSFFHHKDSQRWVEIHLFWKFLGLHLQYLVIFSVAMGHASCINVLICLKGYIREIQTNLILFYRYCI